MNDTVLVSGTTVHSAATALAQQPMPATTSKGFK
jgi:hypothetical protein